jgi:hypothetical protein
MLGVRFLPWGLLWSGEAGLDLGVPWALTGGFWLPVGHGSLVYAGGDACLLDQPDPTLGGLTSREQW